MLVWVTRSQPGADRQAEDLRKHGYSALVAPVVSIEQIPGPVHAGAFTDLIFLSEHAVRFGVPRLPEDPGPTAVQVYAVGSNTATRLAEVGFAAAYPAVATSEGLLDLPGLSRPAGRRILLVAGEGGRDVLAAELRVREATVEKLTVYRRRPVTEIDHDLASVEAIAVASGDGFEFAARVWFAADGPGNVPVFVPSARVAALGERLGFSRVFTCAGAGSRALLEGLAAFTRNG